MSRFRYDQERGLYLPRERRIEPGLHSSCGPAFFASSSAVWRTVFSLGTQGNSSTGWSGYTIRTVIGSSYLGGSATKLRLTFRGSGGGSVTTKCYVQEAAASGDVYDYSGTPVQVLFSGAANFASIAAGVELVSDEVTISLSGTKNLVYGHLSGAAAWGSAFPAADVVPIASSWYRLGDEAATVDATTGYTPNSAYPVVKLEVFG